MFNSKEYDPFNSLVPIYLETKNPSRTIQIGTGVFVDIRNMPFLLTAAHVTDALKNGNLLVPTRDGLTQIEGYLAHIDFPPDISRTEDNTDIAYYRLTSEFATSMCYQFWPLPQNKTFTVLSAHELSVCTVAGYPSNRSKKNSDGLHTSNIFSYRGVLATQEIYEELDLSHQQNIIIRFNRNNSVSPKKLEKTTPPIPKGVSGGAIFSWPEGEEISEDWSIPNLVGIFHTYKIKENLMIGTSLISVMAAITLGEVKGYGGVT